MNLSKEDHDRIARAIYSAKAKTSGDIVCVLAQTSSQTTALPVFVAAVVALALPWLLTAFTAMTVQRILSLQTLAFFLLLIPLCLPRVQVALMPPKARRARAHQAAMEQFHIRGLGRRNGRAGVLIFVSLAERYARIIADDELASRLPQADWQAAVDALIVHMRDGRIADGFITAINVCGSHIAKHFPHTETGNEARHDRIYLI
jgi:putative membrane protein